MKGIKFGFGLMTTQQGLVALDDLVGRSVFKIWSDRRVFESVRINDAGAVEWPGNVDLCADSLYLRLTGKQPEDFNQNSRVL